MLFGKTIPEILYENDVQEEIKNAANGIDSKDFELLAEMLSEINALGYNIKYLADVRWRKIEDKNIIPIVDKYLLLFENTGISEELLQLVSYRGFTEATQIVLKLYERIKNERVKICHCASCDNALFRIADKSMLPKYMEYLQSPEDVISLPLTMELLGKWKNQEAKHYFINYLDSNNDGLVFVSLHAIKHYKCDTDCIEAVKSLLKHSNPDVVKLANKVMKRLNAF